MNVSEWKPSEAIVQQGSSGKRMDAFIAVHSAASGLSRAAIRAGIESGLVTLNGKTEVHPSKRLRYGDVIVSRIEPIGPAALYPNSDLAFPVLYEDDDLLVLSKPAGAQMHPAGGDTTDTVANWIAAARPSMAGVGDDPLRPGIVHRLDRNTSGVVVLAKTDESFSELQELFRSRSAEKTYLALVIGHASECSGSIRYPLATRTGTLRRQAVTDPASFEGETKDAFTEYRVLKRYPEHDLLEVFPKTGRTHQIRIHLSAIGNPVLGDRLYGGRRMRQDGVPMRQLLHASSIRFPFHGTPRHFEAPLPADFAGYLAGLDAVENAGYPGEVLNRQEGV